MSNPAVTKLVKDNIAKQQFYMDDNIGESIHIHYGDIRLDLTIDEFHKLCTELRSSLDLLVNLQEFNCQMFDPVFLSVLLGKNLSHLTNIKMDTVNLDDLYVGYRNKFGFNKIAKISNSRVVKALNGDPRENEDSRESHHIGQTSMQRLNIMKESIKLNGYPFNNNYIILYESQNLIRDGQHRASCMYYLFGKIDVPVIRLYFDDPSISKYEKNYVKQLYVKIKNLKLKRLPELLRKIILHSYRLFKHCYTKLIIVMHCRDIKKVGEVYYI